jgi:hypothetical protein
VASVTTSVSCDTDKPIELSFILKTERRIMYRTMIVTYHRNKHKIINPMALVRERTIPTERPSLVGEVSENCCG